MIIFGLFVKKKKYVSCYENEAERLVKTQIKTVSGWQPFQNIYIMPIDAPFPERPRLDLCTHTHTLAHTYTHTCTMTITQACLCLSLLEVEKKGSVKMSD